MKDEEDDESDSDDDIKDEEDGERHVVGTHVGLPREDQILGVHVDVLLRGSSAPVWRSHLSVKLISIILI